MIHRQTMQKAFIANKKPAVAIKKLKEHIKYKKGKNNR